MTRQKWLIAAALALLLSAGLWAGYPREVVSSPPSREPAVSSGAAVTPPEMPCEPQPLPTTYVDEHGRAIVTNPESILVLVNKDRSLPVEFMPSDLVRVQVRFPFKGDEPRMYMRREAARALEELFIAADSEGHTLYAVSGFRSYETQHSIFSRRAAELGESEANRTSAYPGQSEHQTGLAMDVSSAALRYRLSEAFANTPEGLWLADNAHRFGFIIRYPENAEHLTGYSFEPWHLRYVGEAAARYIREHSLVLEEYVLNNLGQ